jgi:RNA-directed DNA polymerase
MRQKKQVEVNLDTGTWGKAPRTAIQEIEARAARTDIESRAVVVPVWPSMEAFVECENLKTAVAQVKRKRGAPGIDGMCADDLAAYLKEHWPAIREQLLEGTYKAQPVRRVEIPKATGGTRPLGIPNGARPAGWRSVT